MKACFIGLGYIGLPTAIIAANSGIDIVGVDINAEVVEKTQRGKLHILEPGLQPMLKRVVDSGKLVARTTPVPSDAFLSLCPLRLKKITCPTSPLSRRPPARSYPSCKRATSLSSSRLRLWAQPRPWPGLSTASGPSSRENPHCLLPRARAPGQCDLRTHPQRPRDRRFDR